MGDVIVEAYVLMEEYQSGDGPISRPIMVYFNQSTAEEEAVKRNQIHHSNYYYVVEVDIV